MQIQRVQTLYLLLAVGALIVFFFLPFGYWDAEAVSRYADVEAMYPLSASGSAALYVPTAIGIVALFVSIFLFKNMPLQKSIVALSGIIVVATMCVVVYILTRGFDIPNQALTIKPIWGGGGILLIAALVAVIAAYRAISSDQRLLRSYNRLR